MAKREWPKTEREWEQEEALFRRELEEYEDSIPELKRQKDEFFASYQNAVQAVWDRRSR